MIATAAALSMAYAAGATPQDVIDATELQRPHVGTKPFHTMITELNRFPALNTRDDWTRLAAALIARSARS